MKYMKLLFLLVSVLFLTHSNTSPKEDNDEYMLHILQQKNYLIRFYKEYHSTNDTINGYLDLYRTDIINNIHRTRIEIMDSITYHKENNGMAGLWMEQYNRLILSKLYKDSLGSETIPLHELTHAALCGSMHICIVNENIMERHTLETPNTVELMSRWVYLTNPVEIQARVMTTRYALDMYDFKTHKMIDYLTFIDRYNRIVKAASDYDDLHELDMICKSPEHMYKLLVESI